MTESEPVITLPSGRQVLQAVRDTLVWHQARGHRISIGPDSIVVAEPPIHPDALFILSSSHIDTAALLDEQQSHG